MSRTDTAPVWGTPGDLEPLNIQATTLLPKTTSSVSLTPSDRVASVINKITAKAQSPNYVLSPQESNAAIVTNNDKSEEQSLSLDELRRRYDDEQVDRFLRVFARVSVHAYSHYTIPYIH